MTSRTKVAISAVVIATAFASGRYSVKQPPAVAITQETKKNVEKKEDTRTDVKTVITKTETPTGETKTVTVIDRTTVKGVDVKTVVDTKDTAAVTPAKRVTTNVSALISYRLDAIRPEYGLSVSRELLGPVTVGAFGLSGGTFGVSIGLNF